MKSAKFLIYKFSIVMQQQTQGVVGKQIWVLLYLHPHGVVARGILFFNRSFFLFFLSPKDLWDGSTDRGTFVAQKVGYGQNLDQKHLVTLISCFNFLFLLTKVGHFLINPQLTSLYCNFSYGSKNGPVKYFGTKKW